jgi:hypothetical protein
MGTEQDADRIPRTVARRRFLLGWIASFGLGAVAGVSGFRIWNQFRDPPYKDILEQVIPAKGTRTSISFGDTIQKVIASGALDPEKLRTNARSKAGLPGWVEKVLSGPSMEPIVLSLNTAPFLLNLFWPLGLSTKAQFNQSSPINSLKLPSFASTGGWTLGRAPNGSVYFNNVESLHLTADQEKTVQDIAKNVFRPCCDNSTFFQDCNHGSALLGLIELAASQGVTVDELYRIALAANSYWFPDHYTKTALYMALYEGRRWREVTPQLILGPRFSSLSGWQTNVVTPLRRADYLSATGQMGQGACAV